MRIRFGMRSLAAIVTIVCIGFWAVPVAMDWYYWRAVRGEVIGTMSEITSSSGEPKIFLGVVRQSEYCLANVEVEWDSISGTAEPMSLVPRPGAVYVEMPDRVSAWAHSPGEVVALLKKGLATN